METDANYTGRFAPTPSGPLHQGSLVAALGSWLAARAAGGRWLVRIEDLDPPRMVPGAADHILRTLEALGLTWDGPVVYQSMRSEAYTEALETLRQDLFWCTCTRAELRGTGGCYPGTCRARKTPPDNQPAAVRVATPDQLPSVPDSQYGRLQIPEELAGQDPVLQRKDGLWGYPLAVVVDDAWQQITEVVRGADLLPLTPAQLWLQAKLGYPQPVYCHLPLVRGPDGRKLSKQNHAPPVNVGQAVEHLRKAMLTLGLTPPETQSLSELLAWGCRNWTTRRRPTMANTPARNREAPWE